MSQIQLVEPAAFSCYHIVLFLWRRFGDDIDLASVKSKIDVKVAKGFFSSVRVRQGDFGGGRFCNDVQDPHPARIAQRLSSHENETVQFAQDFEPLIDFVPEHRVAKHEPSFVKKDCTWLAALALNQTFDTTKQVKQHRKCVLFAESHQFLDFKDGKP